MLRGTKSTNANHYFARDVSRGDYYIAGDALPPMWFGKGAERLGLSGQVQKEHFDALCNNRNPFTGEQLTLRRIKPSHDRKPTQGYDFTFDVPKSVSVIWARTQDPAILDAVRSSARDTMAEIERGMMTRVRKKGADHDRVTGNLICAEFMHMETRPTGDDLTTDPQIHIHNFVLNATYCENEEVWKAGQFRELIRNMGYYEADFESRLATRLIALGYEIEQTGKKWEIAGVGKELRDKFSRRTQEIEAEAAKRGITDPKEKAELGAKTRQPKGTSHSPEELQALWSSRMTEKEREQIDRIHAKASSKSRGAEQDTAELGKSPEQRLAEGLNALRENRPLSRSQRTPSLEPTEEAQRKERKLADEAIAFSMEHLTERVASPRKLAVIAEATRRTTGQVHPSEILKAFDRAAIITREVNGQILCTTEAIVKQEQWILQYARAARGRCSPFDVYERFKKGDLNRGQQAVIRHLLSCPDQLMLVRGPAGAGKTTLMKAAISAIEITSARVVQTLAPGTQESRGVLRKEGFRNADTVARFLVDEQMQKRVANGTLWVDEAGKMGTRTMARLLETAASLGCRVILAGDHRQHKSVERGHPFRSLIQHAGLKVAGLSEIVRQRGALKTAIEALANGDAKEGLKRLDKLGAIEQASPEEMRSHIVREYEAARRTKEKLLFIAPTHAAIKEITDTIRNYRKQRGELKGERTLRQLVSKQLTVAQRRDAEVYEVGDVIQFSRGTKSYVPRMAGFKAGEQVTVIGRNLAGGIMVRRDGALDRPLPLKHADRFDVYKAGTIDIARGDIIRITRNGNAKGNVGNIVLPPKRMFPSKLRSGATYKVAGINAAGNVVCTNGMALPRNFGFIEYGYADTSNSFQGQNADRSVILVPNHALRPVSSEHVYVAASRAKHTCVFYVEDKEKFKDAVNSKTREPDASEWAELPRRTLLERILEKKRHHAIEQATTLDDLVKEREGFGR